jgi:hypothetical protein
MVINREESERRALIHKVIALIKLKSLPYTHTERKNEATCSGHNGKSGYYDEN